MKRFLPFILAGLGVVFVVIAFILRNGTGDADTAITNVTSTFMFVAGGICVVCGLVTYFLRHDEEIW